MHTLNDVSAPDLPVGPPGNEGARAAGEALPPQRQVSIDPRWSLRNAAGDCLPPQLVALLARVQALGSVLGASRAIGLSYRQGLELVKRGEAFLATPLLHKERRRGSRLTPTAVTLVAVQHRFESRLSELLRGLEDCVQAELELEPVGAAQGWAEAHRRPAACAPAGAPVPDAIPAHDAAEPDRIDEVEGPLRQLLVRRSVSPKRLCAPAPSLAQLDAMLQAALRAPDHGGLHPWRVIEFRGAQRADLAHCFEQEKRRRDPLASAMDLRRAREHATRPPALLGFVVSLHPRSKVPVREQWLAAGAALGNLLNAAHQLGFGAIVLSGERCFDPTLMRELGVAGDEHLAGFISLGSIADAPPAARTTLPGSVWSCWTPRAPLDQNRPG